MTPRPRPPVFACILTLLTAASVFAQPESDMRIQPTDAGEVRPWLIHEAPDPASAEGREYAEQQRTRMELERELKKIRATYFHGIRNPEIRQIGIIKLREYTSPAIYPSLLELFRREGPDVRAAILDHLRDLRNDPADATLAWAAVFDHDEAIQAGAQERLKERIAEVGKASYRIKTVVAEGLSRSSDDEVAAAARVAEGLKLYEAIPHLINAQVSTAAVGGGGGQQPGALAYILVGTQQAFVADLQPVVGDSAVAFDPTLGVLTEGTVMRVIDAVVVSYRVDVHNPLVRMTSDAWGRSTADLGWDQRAWWSWYRDEFKPFQDAKMAAEAAEASAASQTSGSTPDRPAVQPDAGG